MANKLKRQQFISDMIDKVEQIDINSIVGNYTKLYRSGSSFNGKSPFRADSSKTSFTTSQDLNIFKDWAIGIAGAAIKFMMELENKLFLRTVFDLALNFGIISQDEYEEYFSRRRYSDNYQKKLHKKMEKKYKEKTKNTNNKASIEVLDEVYRVFISVCNLNEKHEKHLKEVRGYSDSEIKENLLFSFPTNRILNSFFEALEKTNIEYRGRKGIDVLEFIPGFFQKKEDRKHKFQFFYSKGIGLPIFDSNGMIQGIQLRKDQDTDNRYIWFSSSFALDDNNHEKYCKGTSSKSPIDVIFPDEIKYKTLFITEGKFKAQIIAKKYNCVVFSTQGVGNWKGIKNEIEKLKNSKILKSRWHRDTFDGFKAIFLAFDIDMNENVSIFFQAQKLTNVLEEKFEIPSYYLVWKEKFGKGIDDCILEHGKDKVSKFKKSFYEGKYEKVIDLALEKELPKIKKDNPARYEKRFEGRTKKQQIRQISSDVFKDYYRSNINKV